jgi:hypothetical protein
MDALFGYCSSRLYGIRCTVGVDVGPSSQEAAETALDSGFWERCSQLENYLLRSLQSELLKRCQSSASASRCNEMVAAVTILVSFQQFIKNLYPEKVGSYLPRACRSARIRIKVILTYSQDSALEFCQHVKAILVFFLDNRLPRPEQMHSPITVTSDVSNTMTTVMSLDWTSSFEYLLAKYAREFWYEPRKHS